MVLYLHAAEPSKVKLHVDGSTDKCSKGEDINFMFTGFTIFGQVRISFVINQKISECDCIYD